MTTETEPLTLTAPDDSRELALRRAPRIREEEVRHAADALLLDGGRPTVERVRARLGRGSPNTIALYLDRWWALLGARLRDLPGQELPSVPEPVSKSLMGLWSAAIDEARSLLRDSLAAQATELEAQHVALAARGAELQRAQQEFARERSALEQTVAIVQDQLAQANERHHADAQRLRDLQDECMRLVDQHERLRQEAADSALRLDAARMEHQDVLRALQERSEATERHWMKQVDEVRQALTRERKRSEALDRERVAEITRLTSEVQSTHTDRANIQAALGAAHEKLASTRAEFVRLEAAVKLHESRAEDAAKRLEEHAANALTPEQFEQRLREVLTKALANPAVSTHARRRFAPGDKSSR